MSSIGLWYCSRQFGLGLSSSVFVIQLPHLLLSKMAKRKSYVYIYIDMDIFKNTQIRMSFYSKSKLIEPIRRVIEGDEVNYIISHTELFVYLISFDSLLKTKTMRLKK